MFRIPLPPPGALCIVRRPRGGDWLDDDIAGLARDGIGVVVSLLCPDEQNELGLEREAEACGRYGIAFMPLPVPDRGSPHDTPAFISDVRRVAKLLRDGASVAVHCRQSVGRSGLLAVSVAVSLGASLDSALDIVSKARSMRVPETTEQDDWLRRNVAEFQRND